MTSVYRGITVPDLTDPPNAPAQLRAMVDTGGAVPRFATLAEARAAYPAGARPAGMMVAIGTRLYISNGSDFVSVAAGGIEAFATAAARASAMPSPALGQTTTLDTWPGSLHTWTGSQWMTEQAGSTFTSTDADAAVYLNFPQPFTAIPTATVFQGDADAGFGGHTIIVAPIIRTPSYVGVIFRGIDHSGTPVKLLTLTQVTFHWRARGPS